MTVVLGIYALVVIFLTRAEFKQNRRLQVWFKPLAALFFILIAILGGAIYWEYGVWVLWALFACAIGDVMLLARNSPAKFKIGMAAFAIGHILYIIAFVRIGNWSGVKIWGALAALAAAGYLIWIWAKLPKDMKIPVLLYTTIIVVMVLRSLDVPLWFVPIAAILFAISDMFVAKDRFVKEDPVNALAITPLYFGAQGLFAISAWI